MKTKRRITKSKTKRRKGGAAPSANSKPAFYFFISVFRRGVPNVATARPLITKVTHPELFEEGTTYQQIVDELIKINHNQGSIHSFNGIPVDESRLELYVYHHDKRKPAFIINFANLGAITEEPIEHGDLLILKIRDEDKISSAIKNKYPPFGKFDEMVHEVTTQSGPWMHGSGKRKTRRRLSSA